MIHETETDRLSRYARDEAERQTPAFSEVLHARVMKGVHTAEPAGPLPMRSSHWPIVRAAAAIVLVAGALWAVRLMTHSNERAQMPQPAPPPTSNRALPPEAFALLDSAGAQIQARAARWQDTLAEHQWAGLDQDVKRAAHFLLDQLPLQPPNNVK